jgi:hypothetical protein
VNAADRHDRDQSGRAAGLATLRWVLGEAPVALEDFLSGFGALPPNLRPLAADLGLRHFDALEAERGKWVVVVRKASVRWMARNAVVRDIRSALDGSAVPAVFLKGVALAEQVYPRPALRTSSDIDVWIRPGDLPVVVEALSSGGFVVPPRFREPSTPRGPVPMTYFEKHVAGVPVLVDVHVRPMSLRDLTDDEVQAMWASGVGVGPTALPVLPLDMQLLHVCLHVARSHAFVGGLKALVDIAMIVHAWPEDELWTTFASRVVTLRAEHSVWVCLELARELLGVSIPQRVIEELGAGGERGVIDQARPMLWSLEPNLPLGAGKLLGGGLPEPGWFQNRLALRVHITREEREGMSLTERPNFRLIARFFWRRLASVSRLVFGGEAFRPSFWTRVRTERSRHRLLENLYRLETRRRGSRSIES